MTENKLRTQVVCCANNWLGLNEKDGSHKKIIDIYNSAVFLPRAYKVKYTDAWCAAFVTAIGIHLGLSQIILPECGVGEMAKLYRKIGRFRAASAHRPQAGDLVVYDWEGNGTGDHIGVVEWVWDKNMTVIEGNYKNAVTRRELKTDSKSILGYCLPNYDALAGEVTSVKTVQQHLNAAYSAGLRTDGIYGPKTKKALIKALQTELKVTADGIFGPITASAIQKNVLGKGCRGELVRILQMLLICQGYKLTADGIFGAKTENALRTYQKKTSLAPDGLAGKNTFRRLTMDN